MSAVCSGGRAGHPITGRLVVQFPFSAVHTVMVSLGKTLHQPCLQCYCTGVWMCVIVVVCLVVVGESHERCVYGNPPSLPALGVNGSMM